MFKQREAAYRILAVDLEPTPYKTDLWNCFSDARDVELLVVYTERKNWSPDGGHNYVKWPVNRHANVTLEGKGFSGSLRSALYIARKIVATRPDLIWIAGYVHLATIVALILSIVLRIPFAMHSDEFNNGQPEGRFGTVKLALRELLRWLIFRYGEAVQVCGRRGRETALAAGCPEPKIKDFPYVIDVARMRTEEPDVVPEECLEDLRERATVIFFSGRMIPRKGLPTLLSALSETQARGSWTLWIEGDGPELARYKALAKDYGVDQRCRFLGFCQYDLHSWLIRSADIVVVPSLVDTWGIVVDEGIQLGKAVVSSDATGSGYDRIVDGQNGFIFPAGNAASLSSILADLIVDKDRRKAIGAAAQSWAGNVRPEDNRESLLVLLKNNHGGINSSLDHG